MNQTSPSSSATDPSDRESSSEPRRPDLSVLRRPPETSSEPPSRSRGRLLVVILLVALLGAAAAWTYLAPAPFLRPAVETVRAEMVTPTQASTVLTAAGYTYARDRAAVGARQIGRVVEIRVDEGDRVEEAQVIAVLDSADLRSELARTEAQLLEARARLANAEREAERQRRLGEEGIVSRAEVDAAETALEVSRAQVETATAAVENVRARLDYTVVRAPLAGTVVERNVEVGEMVAPGGFTTQQSTGSLVRIADLDSLEVEADVNEAYIARLEIGQPASIEVDAVPDRTYRGRLRQVVPTADRQRAVVPVKVTIEDPDERLVPDMSATVTFLDTATPDDLEREPRVWVDAAAVVTGDAGARVWRLDEDDRIEEVPVTTGARRGEGADERLEITAGLDGGEVLVADPGAHALADGTAVRRTGDER